MTMESNAALASASLEEAYLLAIQEYRFIAEDDRPCSLQECYLDDGFIDNEKYEDYKAKEDEMEHAERNKFFCLIDIMDAEEKPFTATKKPRKKRTKRKCKVLRPCYFDEQGHVVFLKPRETLWYRIYCNDNTQLPQGSKLMTKFRRRFRMPYEEFRKLLVEVQQHILIARWIRPNCSGDPPSPVGLLLLGALRYLGRGLTFDDLEEFTAIDEETHRQFFHKFIEYGENVLYPKWVKMPTTAEDFKNRMKEYWRGGLYGCGFSSDATNVIMWRCEHNLKQMNMGFKQSHPARSYNVCVNHRRQILHSTEGHPSRWNDKTLAWFDAMLAGIHNDRILNDVKFFFYYWDGIPGESTIWKQCYTGAWGLVDNGYHRWACTQAPAKVNSLIVEQRLSDWIESFRKDVECVFGILKGHFRILKTGIRLQGATACYRVWLTCCALHNMLLEVDGLHENWEEGFPSDWECSDMGGNNASEMARMAPYAIRRLNNPQLQSFGDRAHERSSYERTRMSNQPSTDEEDSVLDDDDTSTNERQNTDGSIYINSLSYYDFRARLVEHFDILHRQNKIEWPQRNERP